MFSKKNGIENTSIKVMDKQQLVLLKHLELGDNRECILTLCLPRCEGLQVIGYSVYNTKSI